MVKEMWPYFHALIQVIFLGGAGGWGVGAVGEAEDLCWICSSLTKCCKNSCS